MSDAILLSVVASTVAAVSAMSTTIGVAQRRRVRRRRGPYRIRVAVLIARCVDSSGEARSILGVPTGVAEAIADTLARCLLSRSGLSVYEMVCGFLFWLRHYPRLSLLSAMLGNIGETTALCVIRDVMPLFIEHYAPYIRFQSDAPRFVADHDAIGIIDGTALNVHRPGQDE